MSTLTDMRQDSARTTSLADLPPELLLRVVCVLPSFLDALRLLSTCRGLRSLWQQYPYLIYRELSGDPCIHDALPLLEAPEVASLTDLTASHAISLSRIFQRMEKTMRRFEKDILCRTGLVRRGRRDRKGVLYKRPLYFSLAERVRFSRAYYHFWTLVKMNSRGRKEFLRTLNLKRLCMLYEMSKLKRHTEDHHARIELVFDDLPSREAIEKETWDTLEDKVRSLHGCDADDLEIWLWQELEFRRCSYRGHVVMFDGYQDYLKDRICDCWPEELEDKYSPAFLREHIWDEDI